MNSTSMKQHIPLNWKQQNIQQHVYSHCQLAENIQVHFPTPTEGFWFEPPPLLWKFQFKNNWLLRHPTPLVFPVTYQQVYGHILEQHTAHWCYQSDLLVKCIMTLKSAYKCSFININLTWHTTKISADSDLEACGFVEWTFLKSCWKTHNSGW